MTNNELFEQLAGILGEIQPDDDANVRLLSDLQLTEQFNSTRQALLDTGQMLEPTTQEGRDLHSRRAALLIEMDRRWPRGKR